jgi:hypothetical protein
MEGGKIEGEKPNNDGKQDGKTAFINNVQRWVYYENQIKLLNEKLRELREEKTNYSEKICKYISENKMEKIKIEITNGEIKLFEKKEYKPLSFSYIENCLQNIINNKSQIEYIVNYLRNNREITSYLDIKKISKK